MRTLTCIALAAIATLSQAHELIAHPSDGTSTVYGLDYRATYTQGSAPNNTATGSFGETRVNGQWLGQYGLFGRWPANLVQWWMSPLNIPANLTFDQVLAAMQTAAGRWSQMCNISFQYMGTTSIPASTNAEGAPTDRTPVWGFATFPAGLENNNGWGSPRFLGTGGDTYSIIDGDIALNVAKPWDPITLEGTLTHEIGHVIGIGHSDVSESVMFANPYHLASYTRTLRGDDAAACTALYGASPNQLTNRTLNWAESRFATALVGGPMPTQGYDGYTYRFYPQSNSYAGTKNGQAYYMVGNGPIQDMGPLSGFTSQVEAAGF